MSRAQMLHQAQNDDFPKQTSGLRCKSVRLDNPRHKFDFDGSARAQSPLSLRSVPARECPAVHRQRVEAPLWFETARNNVNRVKFFPAAVCGSESFLEGMVIDRSETPWAANSLSR